MLKARYWIGVITAPILLASAGCNISPRPHSTAKRVMTPDRLMSMALTFERQGHINQAKTAYRQILAIQPDYPDARENLETLIASETSPSLRKNPATGKQSEQLIAQSKSPPAGNVRRKSAVQEKASAKSTNIASSTPVVEPLDDQVKLDPQELSGATRTVSHDSVPLTRRKIDDPFPDAVVNATIARSEPATSALSNSTGAVEREFGDLEEPMLAVTESKPLARSTAFVPAEPIDDNREQSRVAASRPAPSKSSTPSIADEFDEQESREAHIAAAPSLVDNSSPFETEEPVDGELVDLDITAELPISRATPSPAPAGDREEPILADVVPVSPADADPAMVDEDASGEPVVAATKPGPTSNPDSKSAAQNDADIEDLIKFETPIIKHGKGVDAELEPFLGTFHVRMIQTVKANREQIQPKLARLAADQDSDTDDRSRAVFLLGAIGPDAIQVVPVLRREMHYDVDEFLRVDLSEAILKIQPEDSDAIQVLVDCLKETDENVRWVAAFALRNAVSPRTTFVIDALVAALKTDDLKLRRMLFLTLAEFGPAAVKAVPELEAALESSDPATREVAKASLASIAPDRKACSTIEKVSHRVQFDANK